DLRGMGNGVEFIAIPARSNSAAVTQPKRAASKGGPSEVAQEATARQVVHCEVADATLAAAVQSLSARAVPPARAQEARNGMDVRPGHRFFLRAFSGRGWKAAIQNRLEPGRGRDDAPLQSGLRGEPVEFVRAPGFHAAPPTRLPAAAHGVPAATSRQAGGPAFEQPEEILGLNL